jgi:glc operon protein GlcG
LKTIYGAAMAFVLVGASLAQAQAPQADQGMPGNGGGAPRGPRQPEVVAPSMPIDLAIAAAKAAVAACSIYHFGVAVLDQAGKSKLIYVMDGASGDHGNRAVGKAAAALLINAPSEGLKDRAAADPAIADKVKAAKDSGVPMMAMAGGLPIVVNGQVIGAIGVSGAEPGGHDKECVTAALAAVQGQLK